MYALDAFSKQKHVKWKRQTRYQKQFKKISLQTVFKYCWQVTFSATELIQILNRNKIQ